MKAEITPELLCELRDDYLARAWTPGYGVHDFVNFVIKKATGPTDEEIRAAAVRVVSEISTPNGWVNRSENESLPDAVRKVRESTDCGLREALHAVRVAVRDQLHRDRLKIDSALELLAPYLWDIPTEGARNLIQDHDGDYWEETAPGSRMFRLRGWTDNEPPYSRASIADHYGITSESTI